MAPSRCRCRCALGSWRRSRELTAVTLRILLFPGERPAMNSSQVAFLQPYARPPQFRAQIALHQRARPGVEWRHVHEWIGPLELAVARAPGGFEEWAHDQLDHGRRTRRQRWQTE